MARKQNVKARLQVLLQTMSRIKLIFLADETNKKRGWRLNIPRAAWALQLPLWQIHLHTINCWLVTYNLSLIQVKLSFNREQNKEAFGVVIHVLIHLFSKGANLGFLYWGRSCICAVKSCPVSSLLMNIKQH